MLKTRIIPSLLIKNGGLVKTVKFKNDKYVGDPINAIKIFNDKEVDELIVLDISATKRQSIDYGLLARINKEAFMPMGYGGGIKTLDDISRIIGTGYEKVVLNTSAVEDPNIIEHAARLCGSQSVVVCIDVKKDLFGRYRVYKHSKHKNSNIDVCQWAQEVAKRGAGEIILNNVDKEGTFTGYDNKLISMVSSIVKVPVVAMGGASCIDDFRLAVKDGGASAVAAGSMFVFHGPHRAVLITYPEKEALKKLFS